MTNKNFVNMKATDRFDNEYKLTGCEIKFALLCTFLLSSGCLFGVFYWMFENGTK
jgi:hypothetical protein